MKSSKRFSRTLNKRFEKKQNQLMRQPGTLGDATRRLAVAGQDGFVYVTLGDRVVPVFNNRVANQVGVKVWVGYVPEEPNLFQVISTRSETPAGVETGFVGYAPARRYEWHAINGGQDPLYVHLRAMTPLRIGVSSTENAGTLYINLYRGFIYSGTGYVAVPRQDVDLYAHIPTDAGKAALVLITIDITGTVVQTKGSEVNIEDLALTDLPAIPDGTAFICGAVRVYTGQTLAQEGRISTDFLDLRWWTGIAISAGSASAVAWDNIIDVPAVFPPDTSYIDPLYVRKFDSVVDPTVNDDISIGYLKNDLWHNTVSRSYFLCHDNADGAADWFALGQGGGDASFVADGALAVIASSAANVIVFTKDTTIEDWYFYIEDKGTAGTTILDVHYAGGASIFTTQANRPSIAYNAGSNLMIATADVTQFLAGDVLELQIDQVATGAMSLVLVGNVTGSGGSGGGSMVTVDDGVTQVNVGNILFDGATVTDDGGGQATVKINAAPSADTPPASPDAMDDEFDGVSLDAKWTIIGNGTFTTALSNGLLRFTQAASSERLKGVEQSVSGSSWRFRTHAYMNQESAAYNGIGMFAKDSASGKINWFGAIFHTSYGFYAPYMVSMSTPYTLSSDAIKASWLMGQSWYYELEYDGTNFYFRHSADGYNYCDIFTFAQASYLGTTPDRVGIAAYHDGIAIDGSFGWFRRMA